MTRVMAFGTFDVLHEGHRFLFREAKKFGDELIVVVARDVTVKRVKGRLPEMGEEERRSLVEADNSVDKAVLGNVDDQYKVIEKYAPDVLCLGYDQRSFVDKLPAEMKSRGLSPQIVRLPSHEPDKYKSSIIKRQRED